MQNLVTWLDTTYTTAHLMASHLSVSDHKAMSGIGRSLLMLIKISFKSSSPVISVNFQQSRLEKLCAQTHSKLCDWNEWLDGLPSSEPLLSGIQTSWPSSGNGQSISHLNLFFPRTFAENPTLRLVKLFSGYCLAKKKQNFP